MQFHVLTDIASLWVRQRGIFYFFLLFLSLVRKARNAIIMLPKVANNVSIPMNIEIISTAVILRTSLPMYESRSPTARGMAYDDVIRICADMLGI